MKVGYFTLSDNNYGSVRSPNDLLQDILEEAMLADELGLHSAWIGEHHFNLFGTCPSPQVFLAHLAARSIPSFPLSRVIRLWLRPTLPILLTS